MNRGGIKTLINKISGARLRSGRYARGLALFFLSLLICVLLDGCGQRSTGGSESEAAPVRAEETELIDPVGDVSEEPDGGSDEDPSIASSEAAGSGESESEEDGLTADIAAGHISWDNAPEIGDRESLMSYMRLARDNRLTEVPVKYTDGYMADYEEILKAVNLAYIDFDIRSRDEDNGSYHVLYTLTYYPGERVADAYIKGSTEGLTEEELYLYREAAFLVGEAMKLPTELHRELFLHDQVIGRATYHNRKERVGVPRFCTAVGALLDGQANCQGYADAFQMLARMAGLEVGKQSGYAGGEEHMWNTVLLHGRRYAVDCTWDDASYTLNGTEYTSYAYFNAPLEILSATHSFDDYTVEHEIADSLKDAPDYFYTTELADDNYFGHGYASMNQLIDDAADRLDGGAGYFYGMAPADGSKYKKYSDVTRAVKAAMKKDIRFFVIFSTRGSYSFVTIDAKGGEKSATGEETQTEAPSDEAFTGNGQVGEDGSALDALTVKEDGVYTSAEDVALYIHLYSKLPSNFITKNEARALGWEGGSLEPFAEGMCIGGDRFGNYEGLLPDGKYKECDIDTLGASSRGAKRIIYSEDGRIYYTEDHYGSFTQLY